MRRSNKRRSKITEEETRKVKTKSNKHGGSKSIDDSLPDRPRRVKGDRLVETEEHGEGGEEIDAVKDGADGVHGKLVLMGVVRDGRDGPGFHESSDDG